MASKKSRSESEDTVMAPVDIEPTPDFRALCAQCLDVLTLLSKQDHMVTIPVWESRRYMAGYKDAYVVRDLVAELKRALAL